MQRTPFEQDHLQQIFYPHWREPQERLFRKEHRLVHYTSFWGAINIIRSKQFWLNHTSTMNDLSEVQHGAKCLANAYNGEKGKQFRRIINAIHPDSSEKIENVFNDALKIISEHTFIGCHSEHSPNELELGKLSMWRAYAKGGVAFVLNTKAFFLEDSKLNSYVCPISYMMEDAFETKFLDTSIRIEEYSNELKELEEEHFHNLLLTHFIFYVLGTKHKAFEEEREWRTIYLPKIAPSPIIREVRQKNKTVHAIPLERISDTSDLSIPNVIEKVLIGPTNDAATMRSLLIREFENAGVTDPEHRIVISNIPLR